MIPRLLFLIFLVIASASGAQAQTDPARALREWSSLSKERQDHILRNYRRYQGKPAQEKRRLKERYRRFLSLSPAGREELRENWLRFRSGSLAVPRNVRARPEGRPAVRASAREGRSRIDRHEHGVPRGPRGSREHGSGPHRR